VAKKFKRKKERGASLSKVRRNAKTFIEVNLSTPLERLDLTIGLIFPLFLVGDEVSGFLLTSF